MVEKGNPVNMRNIKYDQFSSTDSITGEKIRERRKMLGMSQQVLGNKIGITFQQVQKYEKGLNKLSLSQLLNICNALKCKIDYFTHDLYLSDNIHQSESLDGQLVDAFRKIDSVILKKRLIALIEEIASSKANPQYSFD